MDGGEDVRGPRLTAFCELLSTSRPPYLQGPNQLASSWRTRSAADFSKVHIVPRHVNGVGYKKYLTR